MTPTPKRAARLKLGQTLMCKCGSDKFYAKVRMINGAKPQVGAYCPDCAQWLRWYSHKALE